MKSKLALFLYIVGLSAITYWAYPIINERYFSDGSKSSETISSEQGDCSTGDVCEINLDSKTENNEELIDKESIDNANPTEDILQSTQPTNAFLEIGRNDCDNECIYFEAEKEKQYCLQICGLSTSSQTTTDGCETLSGLDRDYCWKKEAVEKTEFSICQKIEDSGIREVCQNRITEDIIDKQMLEN